MNERLELAIICALCLVVVEAVGRDVARLVLAPRVEAFARIVGREL